MTVKTPPRQHRSSATRLAGKDIAGVTRVVAKSELEQIRQRAVILTDAAAQQLKLEREEQQAATRHESQERKHRMMEKEIEVRARREQSAMELELEAERKALLTGNEAANNPHLESLRKINSLAMAATGYQLCDALKEHQRERQVVESRYNNVHDSIMERERRRDIQTRKDAEVEAHAKRLEARQVLEEQIAERQRKAIREEEAKAIEAQKILKTYKQYELEEQVKVEQQREKKKETMRQVAHTNDRIKQMKEDMAVREKTEELAAAAYLRKKALEEEAKLREEARIRKSKELRTAKLRAQQEKAQDKQAIQDEFRAKKAYEETEKNTRLKEKRDKERKIALMQSILQDRKKQEAFHAEQAHRMRDLDANMDRIGQQQVEREYQQHKAADAAAKERELQHGDLLQQQIESNEQRQRKAKMFEQNDAKFLKKKALKESILAEKVRVDTLQRLEKRGVPEEYLRDLRRMNINESNA
ncbi:Cilia- and flagella-associated protein 45 [Phytophthora pseudosyringae]|uniref:Cilia- and flagella-associated protein 45 n=1 Tax=Phytophthora pseudosyringae TaxID=221518 RepID=A0A8T1V4F6_9STRA|nr:Cilia- and flagella-associated protein 45 [Phytophthora pseudosyringae]